MNNLGFHSHRKVRRVMARNDQATEELCALAMGARIDWTLPDWRAMLQELDACELSVTDWLALND